MWIGRDRCNCLTWICSLKQIFLTSLSHKGLGTQCEHFKRIGDQSPSCVSTFVCRQPRPPRLPLSPHLISLPLAALRSPLPISHDALTLGRPGQPRELAHRHTQKQRRSQSCPIITRTKPRAPPQGSVSSPRSKEEGLRRRSWWQRPRQDLAAADLLLSLERCGGLAHQRATCGLCLSLSEGRG
jgi:hypothetical protein